MENTEKKVLTPQELADHLQVPVSWVYKQSTLKGPGKIPMFKAGKYIRFHLDKVLEWSEQRSIKRAEV